MALQEPPMPETPCDDERDWDPRATLIDHEGQSLLQDFPEAMRLSVGHPVPTRSIWYHIGAKLRNIWSPSPVIGQATQTPGAWALPSPKPSRNDVLDDSMKVSLLRGDFEVVDTRNSDTSVLPCTSRGRPAGAGELNARCQRKRRRMTLKLNIVGLLCLAATGFMVKYGRASSAESNRDEISDDISQIWGQYSPVFSVPSPIDPSIPNECEATFGLILSRHGARYPTAHKTEMYNATITRIQSSVTEYGKGYEWLKTYTYSLGADDLTEFGQEQLVDSGVAFYKRYRKLARKSKPFIRAAGSDRVVMSSYNFTQGFFTSQGKSWQDRIGDILIVPEEDGTNNTMSHGNCAAFEDDGNPYLGDHASDVWRGHFIPSVTKRLNKHLPGAELTEAETIYLMDLCPFNTVNTPNAATRSKFCRLFTKEEWQGYDYLLSVDKFYGYGNGNPLGPTQGIGYVNELIARLTKEPVVDHTTTNTTLDASPETFPLDRALYADFSHDNVMVSIFSAMGLYNETRELPTSRILPAPEANGYSSSWVVPFGARMYVEKLSCTGTAGEYVRVLVNDRVIPLKVCGTDKHGRCKLDDFVNSLSFARKGGLWDQCAT